MSETTIVVARRLVVVGATLLLPLLVLPAMPARSQEALLSTPYPSVAVEAGETHTFPLHLSAPEGTRVSLGVSALPDDWSATLRGGGFVVDGVTVGPDGPPEVELEVRVPPEASEGAYEVVVEARSSGASTRLPLALRVAEAVGGQVRLEAEFPALRDSADADFRFNLDLVNDTPEETTFSLEAVGPPGWIVEARPSGQQRAATVTVPAGDSTGLIVEVDPPDGTTAGAYPVGVRASGGGRSATAELQVEVTGNEALTLTTADERLNATVQAGRAGEVELVVRNDGTAPLTDVELAVTNPSGWRTTFRPETVDVLEPGDSAEVTAVITPTSEAIAGDYVVTLRARTEGVSDEIEIRATVETSRLWGVVGVGLILVAVTGLGVVFQRYGRR